MIGKESLKGYILEELIAYLIRNTGYKLLVDPIQDERELARKGNGLVVKGRGAVHQADVLGQLAWIPAFTFPLRLFVEAKCRRIKTGIPEVRNAVGILDDINQNYSPMREGQPLIQRFSYRYALFSTSGFTKTASDMALAHQISLIDLSGPDFEELRCLVDEVAERLISDFKIQDIDEAEDNEDALIHTDDLNDQRKPKQSISLLFRLHMRKILGTWPKQVNSPLNLLEYEYMQNKLPSLDSISEVILIEMKRYKEFFVAMANGPFLLIFKSDNPEAFIKYVNENPVHKVTITWTRRNNMERQWIIHPVNDREAYSLSFGLPQTLGDWIFGDEERALRRAWNVKERFLSDITIYRFDGEKDQLIRLIYDANATKERIING